MIQTRTIQCHVRQPLKQSNADTQQLAEMQRMSHLIFKQSEMTIQHPAATILSLLPSTTTASFQTDLLPLPKLHLLSPLLLLIYH